MTDKEVMQMALDVITTPHPGLRTNLSDAMIYREKIKTTIEALRACLAQPEKEWIALTDAEAMEIEDKSPDIRWAIIQAEAKLKEKNT